MALNRYDNLDYYKKYSVAFGEVNLSNKLASEYRSDFSEQIDKVQVLHDVINFYFYNHCEALIKERVTEQEPLGIYNKIMQDYTSNVTPAIIRMFFYLFYICVRESRHLSNPTSLNRYFKNKCKGEWDLYKEFIKDLKTSGGSGTLDTMRTNLPAISLRGLSTILMKIFDLGDFCEDYGGEAWFRIAETFNWYITEKISGVLFLDTAFNLSHNNGPIFNKGYIYKSLGASRLVTVLDIQRAGQIPQYINTSSKILKTVGCPGLAEFYKRCYKIFGATFAGQIDWKEVNKNGVGSYEYIPKKPDRELLIKDCVIKQNSNISKEGTKNNELIFSTGYKINYNSGTRILDHVNYNVLDTVYEGDLNVKSA